MSHLEATICPRADYHFCGETSNEAISFTNEGGISQAFDTLRTIDIGGLTVDAMKRKRNFVLTYRNHREHVSNIFSVWRQSSASDYEPCGQMSREITGSVSENYEYVTTQFYFLDSRYGNAYFKRVTERVTFNANAQEAKFIYQGNAQYHAKYVIGNHYVYKTTEYCMVVKGVLTVVKIVTDIPSLIHGPDNPMILVFPQPPSQGYFDDADIRAHDFYDYQNSGDQANRILNDGGYDFYFTDWMRGVGLLHRDADQGAAWNRYYMFYLYTINLINNPATPSSHTYSSVTVPDQDVATEPVCSIAVDRTGNVFYSAKAGLECFNLLTATPAGDLSVLFPGKTIFCPVGVM
jgi:hypothetical protein